jgi:PKD repeat protein
MKKSLWLRAILALPFLALSACGGGGGGGSGGNNTAPTANFAFSCADLVCSFTSTSSDPDAGDSVATYNWTFGDGSAAATTFNPDHTFAAGGTYSVTLRVGDRFGTAGSVVRQVVVTAPPTPAGPSASFTFSCLSLDCKFTDTSTYAGGAFQSRVWDFGDGTTLAATNPADHRYAVTTLTSFPVKLTVTDAAGKVSTSTQTVPVSPPATSSGCVGGGCVLTLTQASRVTATIVSRECVAQGNQVRFTAPITQLVFANGCTTDPVNVPVQIDGGRVFPAGTTLEVAVSSGVVGTSALVYPPSIRVSGDFANGWTLTFDDGKGGAGEPDFNDLVILIKATP